MSQSTSKLLELIDSVKEKISDQEYREMMDALKEKHDTDNEQSKQLYSVKYMTQRVIHLAALEELDGMDAYEIETKFERKLLYIEPNESVIEQVNSLRSIWYNSSFEIKRTNHKLIKEGDRFQFDDFLITDVKGMDEHEIIHIRCRPLTILNISKYEP